MTLQRMLRACSKAVWFSAITLTAQACAPVASPVATATAGRQPATLAPDVGNRRPPLLRRLMKTWLQRAGTELTLINSARRVAGVWVIFERSLDMLRYYQDADVRAFARRHDLALLFPFHCASKSETGGDMNVDPSKGIGRALFVALTQLAEGSAHPELASSRLILLGFSGTGSLVGRLAEFAPHRVIAVIPTVPGHFDPLGMDTIKLSPEAAAIPHLSSRWKCATPFRHGTSVLVLSKAFR